ncbi:DUF1489 domain-containing protein [Sandaracinobacter sp. RS1-74]|uniref:DUF1489 family protein n=1 Tax=Sandaracinobacteroides sayramensis TaxID=2913411 RepID=UPI001EDB4EC0|nr:DUF1489 family protein [Sandaracinobacteroides sayramensis]MCG2842469.1 DUF1489 domain-containing protein [Sandaracinobacteroides sayramensis]
MSRLGLTRVAYACQSFEDLLARQALFTHGAGAEAHVRLTSARIPRRDLTGGSLFWILKHSLIARQPILGVEEAAGAEGPIAVIRLKPGPIPVVPVHRRAHQGWRYLPEELWPADQSGSEPLPPDLAAELAGLSLL